MLNGDLGENKGVVSDIHPVFVFEDVILTDPDSAWCWRGTHPGGRCRNGLPGGLFWHGGGDEPSHGRDVIRAFSTRVISLVILYSVPSP